MHLLSFASHNVLCSEQHHKYIRALLYQNMIKHIKFTDDTSLSISPDALWVNLTLYSPCDEVISTRFMTDTIVADITRPVPVYKFHFEQTVLDIITAWSTIDWKLDAAI